MMLRSLAALLAAVAMLPAIAAAQTDAFTSGGPVKDGVRAVCDIPAKRHIRNVGGSDNKGLCVFTAVQLEADWQHVTELDGFRAWMERRPGGGWPEKLDQCIAAFCREKGRKVPGYVQHVGGDEAFLRLALASGRMPCVTYAGMDGFYKDRWGRDVQIGHMVNLAYLDDQVAAIIDNNRPGVWVWMTRDEFLARWRAHAGGWAFVLLAPPPPPHPVTPTAFESEQCGPNGCRIPRPQVSPCGPNGCPVPRPRSEPPFPAPGPDFVWDDIPGIGMGWVQKARPQGENFGLVADSIGARVRWVLNGFEVIREEAEKALTDDSDRYHLVAVGDAAFRSAAAVAAGKLTDAARLLVNTYPADHWAVEFFGLKPGVTLRTPAKARVGGEAGAVATVDKLAELVDGVLHPKPPAPPKPDPLPAPQPVPDVDPCPCNRRGYGPYIVAVLVAVLIATQLLNRRS